MNKLFYLFSVCSRSKMNLFLDFLKTCDASPILASLGYGTAGTEIIDKLGLTGSEKAVFTSFVTAETWNKIKKGLYSTFGINNPGTGIAFITPVSSVVGKEQLNFLLGNQNFELGDESEMKNTRNELIVTVSNIGYSDRIMSVARENGAGGGTVIHAKGTGMEGSEKFMGITLASEKEITLIVARTECKNKIMTAISQSCGKNTEVKAIVFSLPVSDTAGIVFKDAEEAEETV